MRPVVAAFVLALGLVPVAARAEQHDSAAADALFEQGRKAADAGDFVTACQKFYESNRLDPAPGTVLNIADCEEKQGHVATAWTRFEEARQRLPESDERAGIARQRAQQLKPRIPLLTVRLVAPPAGARVLRDGIELGAASLDTPLPVDPGPHEIVVEAPGRARGSLRFSLAERETKTVEVRAGAEAEQRKRLPPPPSNSSSTLGWILGGVGVVGLGVGTVTGLMVLGKKSTADDHCPGKRCDQTGVDAAEDGRALSPVSTVGFIVGALGLATGAYLLLSSDEKAPSAVAVAPTPYGGGVAWLGRF